MTKDRLKLDVATMTQGAFVLHPNRTPSSIYLNGKIVTIFDFASLYPTIKALFNISYMSIHGRFYDVNSVDNFMNTLSMYDKDENKNAKIREKIISSVTNSIVTTLNRFLNKTLTGDKKSMDKKAERLKFAQEIYPMRLRRILRIIEYYSLDELLNPTMDLSYKVFMDLMVILELLNMFKIDGEHDLAINLLTRPTKLFVDCGYNENTPVWIIKNVHSRKRSLIKITVKELFDMKSNYIINPYGTIMEKHENYMSPDIERIFDGLKNRGIVKKVGLIAEAMGVKMNEMGILQFNSVKELKDFRLNLDNYIQELINNMDNDYLEQMLEMNSKHIDDYSSTMIALSSVMKVFNNSDYGIGGLKTFAYYSHLVSNSTTMGAKIIGLKMLIYIIDKDFASIELHAKLNEELNRKGLI